MRLTRRLAKIDTKHFSNVLFIVAVCAVNWLGCAAVIAADQPNILFILTDDQRLEDIKHMPILQRLLVQQGMSFDSYFSNVSLCCPSRTSILRGQFAHNTGVMTNLAPNGGFGVAHSRGIEDSTIAVWLHEHGYKTGLIGKYLNGYPKSQGSTYIPPGWDYWASSVAGNAYGQYNYTLNENGHLVDYGNKPEDYGTDVYTHQAVTFIKDCQSANKPFFLYLAFYAPHSPATPAPRHLDLFPDAKIPRTKAFDEADVTSKPQYIQKLQPLTEHQIVATDAYYAKRLRSLQSVDEAIETLCKTLTETNQLDNTYIVFASDNGFHLGEHRMLSGKQTAYETDIHLPLIVRGPGVPHGATAKEIVGNIDLAPTFADLAGAKSPDFVDGRSIATILKGQTSKDWREVFLVEHEEQFRKRGRKNRQIVQNEPPEDSSQLNPEQPQPVGGQRRRRNRGKLRNRGTGGGKLGAGELGGIPQYHALRGTDSTFVEYTTGEREYYRLMDDSDQINNLVGKSETKKIEQESARAQQLSRSAANKARQIEGSK